MQANFQVQFNIYSNKKILSVELPIITSFHEFQNAFWQITTTIENANRALCRSTAVYRGTSLFNLFCSNGRQLGFLWLHQSHARARSDAISSCWARLSGVWLAFLCQSLHIGIWPSSLMASISEWYRKIQNGAKTSAIGTSHTQSKANLFHHSHVQRLPRSARNKNTRYAVPQLWYSPTNGPSA